MTDTDPNIAQQDEPLGESSTISQKLAGRAFVRTVQLPSLGLPYGGRLPNGIVAISSMTVSEEKILANPSNDVDDVLSTIIGRTSDLGVLLPGDLITADRMFLMVKIRAISYGPHLRLTKPCDREGCSSEVTYNYDIENEITFGALDPSTWGEEIAVKLPVSGKTVGLRLLTGNDEVSVARMLRDRQVKGKTQVTRGDRLVAMIAEAITRIDDKPRQSIPTMLLIQGVEGLAVRDRSAIEKALTKHSPTMHSEVSVNCSACGKANTVEFELTPEFFRVADDDDS